MKNYTAIILSALSLIIFAAKIEAKAFEKIATIEQGKDAVEFHLKKKKTDGHLKLLIRSEDKKTTYWNVNLRYYQGGVITLGEIPEKPQATQNGGEVMIRQTGPKGRPVFPLNKKLHVYLSFRDDHLGLGPGASATTSTFELDDNGKLKLNKVDEAQPIEVEKTESKNTKTQKNEPNKNG